MILRLAAGLVVVAVTGCTSSGSGTTSSPAGPPPTSSLPTSSQSSSPAPTSSTPTTPSAPPKSSLTAIHPIRPLTCATLPAWLGSYRKGGSLPSGVTLPQAVPILTCTGSAGRIAALWSSVSEGRYRQELLGTGWRSPGPPAVFTKARAPRTIELATVHGDLVAVYKPR